VENMGRIELKVKFETLTPLWTGNAWGQCMEIRPSSILGSLRFWFEVLCYFNGIINDSYFDESGKPVEKFDYKVENREKYDIEE
jgi:CRISPR-associated protein Cmr1